MEGDFLAKTILAVCCYYLHTAKILNMSFFRQLAEYLYIRKPDPDRPRSEWVKYMHGINRISLLLFLFALVVMLIRLVILPLVRG